MKKCLSCKFKSLYPSSTICAECYDESANTSCKDCPVPPELRPDDCCIWEGTVPPEYDDLDDPNDYDY